MKKSLILVSIMVVAWACNQEKNQPIIEEAIVNKTPISLRTIDEARSYAMDVSCLLDDNETKSGRKKIVSSQCITRPGTKSDSGNNADALCYVFNYADDEGFAIISADKRFDPFICVTESGSYNAGTPTGVEGFDQFLEDVLDYMGGRPAPSDLCDSLKICMYTIDRYEGSLVYPLIQTNWGPNDVYGAYCPNGICGCVARAIAQIMIYHAYPPVISITEDMGIYSANDMLDIHWGAIQYHQTGHTGVLACSDYHSEISALAKDIGYYVNMIYYPDSSG